MRYIGLLNDNGEVYKNGFCPDNCDFTTAIGRSQVPGDRWIDGKGETEQEAMENARFTEPNEF